MTAVRGTIVGPVAGAERPVEARVHVLASTGQFRAPPDAVLKVGGGPPFFYADGAFSSSCRPAPAEFVLERGTEFRPLRQIVDVPRRGTVGGRPSASSAGSTSAPTAGTPATPTSTTTSTSRARTSACASTRGWRTSPSP